jgi:hypothetical protein
MLAKFQSCALNPSENKKEQKLLTESDFTTTTTKKQEGRNYRKYIVVNNICM